MIHVDFDAWDSYVDELANNDYVVIDNFLPNELLNDLIAFFNDKIEDDAFDKAAIGSSGQEHIISEVRGDYTYWLDKKQDMSLENLFSFLEEIKLLLNRMCYLSLSTYEFHLAHYPKGSFYKKHLDQFQHRNNRMISVVVYLNDDWKQGDGGELAVYPKNREHKTIAPLMNRCVLFKSADLLHEVLTANRSRKSLTGWMLYQPSVLVTIAP